MNYAKLNKYDIANGTGVRVSLFVSGCLHHCKNCFNSEAWDFCAGKPFTENTINEIIDALKPDYIEGLTLLGGEPFEPQNQMGLLPLLKKVKEICPNKNIWCYTGFVYDTELLKKSRAKCEYTLPMLKMIDILVDGRFVEEKKNLALKFRGSSNQRIIDVKQSLLNNKIILSPLNDYEDFKIQN